MSVLRPRNRLVNFRLSEDEFELLRDSCGLFGARSISDFARTSVLERLSQRSGGVEGMSQNGTGNGTPVGQLGNKVAELEIRVGQILNLLQATEESAGTAADPELGLAPVATSGPREMHERY
jgi:hypothetical protein